MKKARVVAICTVGLVLVLLLGGLPYVDQIHSAVDTNQGTAYAAEAVAIPACFNSNNGAQNGNYSLDGGCRFGCRIYIHPTPDGGIEAGIECWWECD